jgi:hypothetical protein
VGYKIGVRVWARLRVTPILWTHSEARARVIEFDIVIAIEF